MSVSHRNRRVWLYRHRDAGTDGRPAVEYVLEPSGAADKAWWGAVVRPTGREYTAGGQAATAADVVLLLGGAVPVTDDGLAKLDDGTLCKVLTVLPRDYGTDEQQVLAVYASDSQYTLVDA